mmetsp:Transcript_81399/g.226719  ORF Transcript_81399/g.226719 Transcript_81399/m.226719 type:complete len:432 (-) Transcript_81399:30-1325(-)
MAGRTSWPQPSVSAAMQKLDAEVRNLQRCMARAKAMWPAEAADCEAKLGTSMRALQQRRVQLREFASGREPHDVLTDKLAIAIQRIGQELQACQALERNLKAKTSHVSSGGADQLGDPTAGVPSEVKILAEQLLKQADIEVEEFVCKICQTHVVGCDPHLTQCSHIFCGDCLTKWFVAYRGSQSWAQRAQAKGSAPCPLCKQPLDKEKDLFPVCKGDSDGSAALWQVLSLLRIRCANHSACNSAGRCDWIGDYSSYQEHIKGCRNVPTQVDAAIADDSVATVAPEVAHGLSDIERVNPGGPPSGLLPETALSNEQHDAVVDQEQDPSSSPEGRSTALAPDAIAALYETKVEPDARVALDQFEVGNVAIAAFSGLKVEKVLEPGSPGSGMCSYFSTEAPSIELGAVTSDDEIDSAEMILVTGEPECSDMASL